MVQKEKGMKKKLLAVLALCLCVSLLFGANQTMNRQKIHPIDSEVYQAITMLYIQQGMALPSTAGPWSEDELITMLERINTATLSEGEASIYKWIVTELNYDKGNFKFGFEAAVETYAHTNDKVFLDRDSYVRSWDENKPLLDIQLETWLANHFYGYSALSIAANYYNTKVIPQTGTDGKYFGSKYYGETLWSHNIPFFAPGSLADFDFNFPFRAFGAFGGENWSVQVGRDKLSWGPGVSGNFVVGSHLRYHDSARLATYGKNYKYTFNVSAFPHPNEYYKDPANVNKWGQGSQRDETNGLNLFIAHRLEWRLAQDKVGITLTEGIMYQSEDNHLDLRVLSPTIVFHNGYIRSNSNSIVSLEVDYTPIPLLNIYAQFVMDEIAFSGEPVPGKDKNAYPNAFGYMLGAKTSFALDGGIFYGSFEGVLTDPYLYLRDANAPDQQGRGETGINWIVANRYIVNSQPLAGTVYIEDFLGYKYGGDAIVINANAGYKKLGLWSAETNLMVMIHGTHDKWTTWTRVNPDTSIGNGNVNVGTPTTEHQSDNHLDTVARDAVTTTIALSAKGSYTIIENLVAYGQADFVTIVNPGNRKANPTAFDLQLAFGLSYAFSF